LQKFTIPPICPKVRQLLQSQKLEFAIQENNFKIITKLPIKYIHLYLDLFYNYFKMLRTILKSSRSFCISPRRQKWEVEEEKIPQKYVLASKNSDGTLTLANLAEYQIAESYNRIQVRGRIFCSKIKFLVFIRKNRLFIINNKKYV
jgi:hypothetical protein